MSSEPNKNELDLLRLALTDVQLDESVIERSQADLQGPPSAPSAFASPVATAPFRGAARTAKKATSEAIDFGQMLANLVGLGSSFGESREALQQQGGLVTPQRFEQILDESVPQSDGFIPSAMERAGEILPFGLVSSATLPGIVSSSIGAGVAGEAAESFGLGETGQAFAELVGGIAPGLAGRLAPGLFGAGSEALSAGRALGLTDKEIAPLIREGKIQRSLGKAASKGVRTESALKDTKQAIGRAFEAIKGHPSAQMRATAPVQESLNQSVNGFLKNSVNAKLRGKIADDVNIMLSGGVNGEKIINFWQKVNQLPSAERKILGPLKQPLSEALQSIDPGMRTDFGLANSLFQKFSNVKSALKPGQVDQIINLGEAGKVLGAVTTFSVLDMAPIVGVEAARRVAAEMLINPRMQNITAKLVKQLSKGGYGAANKTIEQLSEALFEVDPLTARLVNEFDAEDLRPTQKKRARDLEQISDEELLQLLG